jgi:hypothetical protein
MRRNEGNEFGTRGRGLPVPDCKERVANLHPLGSLVGLLVAAGAPPNRCELEVRSISVGQRGVRPTALLSNVFVALKGLTDTGN